MGNSEKYLGMAESFGMDLRSFADGPDNAFVADCRRHWEHYFYYFDEYCQNQRR